MAALSTGAFCNTFGRFVVDVHKYGDDSYGQEVYWREEYRLLAQNIYSSKSWIT